MKTRLVQLSLGCIFCLACCRSTLATLVICIYNDDAIYIASDGMVTRNLQQPGIAQKIFVLSNSCCAYVTGFVGATLVLNQTSRETASELAVVLEGLCAKHSEASESLERATNMLVDEFHGKQTEAVRRFLFWKGERGTQLGIVGYDQTKRMFFGSAYFFNGTNSPTSETYAANDPRAGAIHMAGQVKFLSSWHAGDKKLTGLGSLQLRTTLNEIATFTPVPQNRVVSAILEMFQLQKEYAVKLGYDDVEIGEPYEVYKITKDAARRIR
jgi:hypothetical protein